MRHGYKQRREAPSLRGRARGGREPTIAWTSSSACNKPQTKKSKQLSVLFLPELVHGAMGPHGVVCIHDASYARNHSGFEEPLGTRTVRKAAGVRDMTTWSVKP